MLLAAGGSRRMGRAKALLPHPDGSGRPMIRAIGQMLLDAGVHPLYVVYGSERARVLSGLRPLAAATIPVMNPLWRTGMLSSVQAGVRAASSRPGVQWALVALVDQPFLNIGLVKRLMAAAGNGSPLAVAPRTADQERHGGWGHPVLFSRELFDEILAEPVHRFPEAEAGPEARDAGARAVLLRHQKDFAFIRAEERELADADTPSQYRRLARDPRRRSGLPKTPARASG